MKSSKPIQDAQTWETQIIRLLWALSLKIWNYRNKDLHGHDTEDALARCTTALHEQIGALYECFQADAHIVSSKDRYLFDKSVEERCSHSNQYIRCWLRSVEIAMELQATQQDELRQQASQHFQRRQPGPTQLHREVQEHESDSPSTTPSTKEQRLHNHDISSPESYNLQRRTWQLEAESIVGDQDAIEPSPFYWQAHDIFWASDSSYNPSIHRDVPFHPDSDFSMQEIQDSGHKASTDTDSLDDSTYQQSSPANSPSGSENTSTNEDSSDPTPPSPNYASPGQDDIEEPSIFYWQAHDIFWESDSSYLPSIRRDAQFHPDSDFSPQELQDSSHRASIATESHDDSTYHQSSQGDITFRPDSDSSTNVNSQESATSPTPVLPMPISMQLTSTQPTEAQAAHIRRPSEVEGMLRFLQERKRSTKLVPPQPRLYPIFRATPNIWHQTPRDESTDITQHTT